MTAPAGEVQHRARMRIPAIYANTVPQKPQDFLFIARPSCPEELAPSRGVARFVELAHKSGRSESFVARPIKKGNRHREKARLLCGGGWLGLC